MKEFLILFKHELRMLFPFTTFSKKKKYDIVGILFSLLLIVGMASLFIMLLSRIAKGYIEVKINKQSDPIKRAGELLNVLYCFITIVLTVGCIIKLIDSIATRQNKQVYLRLPVQQRNIFLAKIVAVMVWNVVISAMLILPINIIFYMAMAPSFVFWIKTIYVLMGLPIIVLGISTILLLPCIKIVDYLKSRYLILFVVISGMLIGAFILYSKFLEILQLLLETGSIKFLFNAAFVDSLQCFYKFVYPINCFANIVVGENILISLILTILFIVALGLIAYFVSNKLFELTMYKDQKEFKVKKPSKYYTTSNQLVALIKKEFVCVYRSPKALFSYLAIALAMPVMVYCCYTLFESLVVNAFGIKVTFSLALLVLLMFSVLTNTFCATNVTREGKAFLKMKSLAIKPTYILLAKVLFCAIVSTLSICASTVLLMLATNLKIWEAAICMLTVVLFSFAQILLATRLDLNHARLSATKAEADASSSKTITKIIGLGLLLALIAGITSVVIYILSQGSSLSIVKNLNLRMAHAYVLPICLGAIYCSLAAVYYNYKIDKSFDLLDK